MSGGTGSETEIRITNARAAAQAQDVAGLQPRGGRITGRGERQPTQTRGLTENLSREALFRRSLLAADVVAIVGAFVLLAEISSKALQLTWVSVCGLLRLILVSKTFGLYDRDEALLHKTTLDETPKLLHVATLGALRAWLAGGFVVAGATLNRREALLLWLLLLILLVVVRSATRALVLRAVPAEHCLFIGDHESAATVRSKLSGHSGVKAEMVAHLDLDDVDAWSAEGFSPQRLSEIRDLARTLDVHRAIVVPGSVDAGEMLDLVRTLKAVGVRVSVLPRLLEVVGSSVEFDDLHGVMIMGVRRFELTRSSAAVKRVFDLIGASLGLLTAGDLAADDRDRGGDQARQPRPRILPPAARGTPRPALQHAQAPHDGARCRRDEGRPARPERGPGGALQDRRRSPRDTSGQGSCAAAPWTSCRSSSTSCGAR